MRNTIRRDLNQTGRSDTFIKKHEKAEIRQPIPILERYHKDMASSLETTEEFKLRRLSYFTLRKNRSDREKENSYEKANGRT